MTRYRTYREDVELESVFKAYTKRNYDSWVAFTRDTGHGDDIKPVLVTGVDMTRDFAMMAYASSGVSLASESTTLVPMVTSASVSAWGTWFPLTWTSSTVQLLSYIRCRCPTLDTFSLVLPSYPLKPYQYISASHYEGDLRRMKDVPGNDRTKPPPYGRGDKCPFEGYLFFVETVQDSSAKRCSYITYK